MLTIGDKVEDFKVIGVFPEVLEDGTYFQEITDKSFEGQWKVIVFYPKDFTFVCPTEIIEYDKLNTEFLLRNTILMSGSTDNEFCKLAWKESHPDLAKLTSIMFADTRTGRGYGLYDDDDTGRYGSLVDQLGVRHESGVALRATFILDPDNVIQHVTVNGLDTGRNAQETLRVLDALQTGELTACSRPIGGATL
jgi:peroxiredoxin (alkyl hydroperoxide reductase subunit C)